MSGDVSVFPAGLTAILDDCATYASGPVQVGRFPTFLANFSGWHLKLSDHNPCIWIQEAVLSTVPAQALAEEIQKVVKRQRWQNCTILLFIDGVANELQSYLSQTVSRFICFDQTEQRQIQTAVSPSQCALELLREKSSTEALSPYETTKPVIGSQFFGRESEINRVLSNPHTNYLFVGIRRIGKTSILKEIKRRLDRQDPLEKGQQRRVFIDCTVISSEDEFMRTLIFQLEQSGLTILASRARDPKTYQRRILEHYAAVHGTPITFLLDEFDRLLTHMKPDWPLLSVLKTAVQSQKVRFIAAGFRRAMEASTNKESPLYNLLTPVRLERLNQADVRSMIVTPFTQLGITIADVDQVIGRIYRETAGLPNYVQFYCKTMINQLANRGKNRLTLQNLPNMQNNNEFRNFVLNTFMSNTELLEQAIVYALISEDKAVTQHSFTEYNIQSYLKKRQLTLTFSQIDRACRNLEMAGVFNREAAEYVFAVPLFQQMLRQTRDVQFLFERTREALQTENILA